MLIRCECRFGIHFTYGDFQKIFDRRYCYRSAEGQQTALDYTNESTGKIKSMFSLCFLSFQLPSAWFSLYLFRLSTHSSSTLNDSIRKRSTIRLHPIRLCVFSTLLFFALLSNNNKNSIWFFLYLLGIKVTARSLNQHNLWAKWTLLANLMWFSFSLHSCCCHCRCFSGLQFSNLRYKFAFPRTPWQGLVVFNISFNFVVEDSFSVLIESFDGFIASKRSTITYLIVVSPLNGGWWFG